MQHSDRRSTAPDEGGSHTSPTTVPYLGHYLVGPPVWLHCPTVTAALPLCSYHASEPEELAELQKKEWSPLIKWFNSR